MNIDNIVNLTKVTADYKRQSYVNNAEDKKNINERNRPSGEDAQNKVNQNDRVSLSSTSKDMQLAKKAVESVEDDTSDKMDRSNKIKQIKHSIDTGQYEVDPEKIAEKMLKGISIDEII